MRQEIAKGFTDRLGRLADGQWMFRCKRSPHKEHVRTFATRIDAEEARTLHDAQFHTTEGSEARAQRKSRSLKEAHEKLIKHLEAMQKSPDTIRDYDARYKELASFFGENRKIETIDFDSVRAFTQHRLRTPHRTGFYGQRLLKTNGHRVHRDVQHLERLAKQSRIPLDWSTKLDFREDLKALADDAKRVPVIASPKQILKFIENLHGIPRALVITKVFTLMRNAELWKLRVKDVNLATERIKYIACAKRKKFPVVAILTPELKAVLAPIVAVKGPDDYVFTYKGRKLNQESYNGEFKAASAAAEILRDGGEGGPSDVIGWIRPSVMTALRPHAGIDAVSKFANHSSVDVTEQFYDLNKDAIELKTEAVKGVRKMLRGIALT